MLAGKWPGKLRLLGLVGCLLTSCDKSARVTPEFVLFRVQADGKLIRNQQPIRASLPIPGIKISKFEISKLRKLHPDAYEYVCDILVVGTVRSANCDRKTGPAGVIPTFSFFVNSDSEKQQAVPIRVKKATQYSNSLLHPFPYEGLISNRLVEVPVTEGVNTFSIVARDRSSQLDAETQWAASFAFPVEPGYEDEASDEEKAVKVPTVTGIKEVRSAPELAPVFYSVGVNPASLKEKVKDPLNLSFGDAEKKISLPLQYEKGLDCLVPIDPDTGNLQIFSLLPSGKMKPFDALKYLQSRKDFAALSERSKFLVGFSQGLFASGMTLMIKNHKFSSDATFDKTNCVFPIRIESNNENLFRGAFPLPNEFVEVPKERTAGETPGIEDVLWSYVELKKANGPKAEDLEIHLITGNFTELGFDDTVAAGWQGDFISRMANPISIAYEAFEQRGIENMGPRMGALFGAGLKVALEDKKQELTTAEFLETLASRIGDL